MCGIFGIAAQSRNVVPLMLKTLKHLAYRGYDSTGVCLAMDELLVEKTVGNVDQLNEIVASYQANTGIGHTRWATHGKRSVVNAHPHTSDGVVIVHNGIIENDEALKTLLQDKGFVFQSETDSEVIAHLLSFHLRQHRPLEALKLLSQELKGRYAFIALIESEKGKIFGLTSNLPLLIGKTASNHSVASDLVALKHCKEYTKATNLTPFYISGNSCSTDQAWLSIPTLQSEVFVEEDITYREILSQHKIPPLFSKWVPLFIPKPKHILFVACGSSFHCAQTAHYWLAEQGIYTTLETASELKNRSLPDLSNSLIIAISQSGETADTLLCMEEIINKPHLHSIAITNTPTSTLAGLCQTIIPLNIGVERGVASTKAVTAQLLSLYHLTQEFSRKRNIFPALGLTYAIQQLYHLADIPKYAKILSQYRHIICLGKHELYPMAKECALKIKELSYIHAEAIPLGELKHGPLALIDQDVFCIILGASNQSTYSEIKARNGPVLRIGGLFADIPIPNIPQHQYLLINIVCQLLSYHIAKSLNRNIDQPRNLAKSVTVE